MVTLRKFAASSMEHDRRPGLDGSRPGPDRARRGSGADARRGHPGGRGLSGLQRPAGTARPRRSSRSRRPPGRPASRAAGVSPDGSGLLGGDHRGRRCRHRRRAGAAPARPVRRADDPRPSRVCPRPRTDSRGTEGSATDGSTADDSHDRGLRQRRLGQRGSGQRRPGDRHAAGQSVDGTASGDPGGDPTVTSTQPSPTPSPTPDPAAPEGPPTRRRTQLPSRAAAARVDPTPPVDPTPVERRLRPSLPPPTDPPTRRVAASDIRTTSRR